MREKAKVKISAGKRNGLLFEKYEYSSGASAPLPQHSHPEYQFTVSRNAVGEYFCRGGNFQFAPLTLAAIHSGERHAPGIFRFDEPKSYCVMYVAPEEILSAAKDIGWRKSELPYFKNLFITDQNLTTKFLRFFAGPPEETDLSEDIAKLDFLTYLIGNFAQNKIFDDSRGENRACVKLAREYLEANFARAVSLKELALIAKVGKYYLCREFKRVVGFSPHQYQNHLRINFARRMLLQNRPLSEISQELGYFDQSHFGRHFKRQIGIAPKFYFSRATLS